MTVLSSGYILILLSIEYILASKKPLRNLIFNHGKAVSAFPLSVND